ncbi:hypothetical protein Tco_0236762 [Tanacetum coccineum]
MHVMPFQYFSFVIESSLDGTIVATIDLDEEHGVDNQHIKVIGSVPDNAEPLSNLLESEKRIDADNNVRPIAYSEEDIRSEVDLGSHDGVLFNELGLQRCDCNTPKMGCIGI